MRLPNMILFAALFAAVGLAADDPFVGKWKLNVEKSNFTPGPPPKMEALTISPADGVTIEGINGAGTEFKWTYKYEEGKQVDITGMGPDSTVSGKRMGRSIEHTWKMAGNSSQGRGVLSKDGKTMTYRIKGTGPDGNPMNNVMVWEREQ